MTLSRNASGNGKRGTGLIVGDRGSRGGNLGNQSTMTDSDTILHAQRQMNAAALDIAKMANDLADAKTIKEFSSDRLKRALSVEVSRFLDEGATGVAAEHRARASTQYGAHLADLQEQHKAALRVIEQCEALHIMFESARSLLSTEKAKMNLL